ncbi:MAG: flagellar biosynthetic protein FliQ [Phycisphaerales bacterium]
MQYDEATLSMVRDALIITLKIAGPILAAGVLVGLVISVLQSVTSIHDQSLTFVPKIIAMVVLAILLLPWIAGRLIEYTTDLFTLFAS